MENLTIRLARREDISELVELINNSINSLLSLYLNNKQVEESHKIMGLDELLLEDETYYLIEIEQEIEGEEGEEGKEREEGKKNYQIIGCGGWSKRQTLYGNKNTNTTNRNDTFLNPLIDSAKIRGMYTHPLFTRKGIGKLLLKKSEEEIIKNGFKKAELMSTVSGRLLYLNCGYHEIEHIEVEVNNVTIPLVKMEKILVNIET